MEALILSGPPAVGKTTVSNILSAKLGMPIIGGTDILKEMAASRGYKMSGDDWWDTAEGMRFVKERETNPDFDREADKRLLEKIERGNVIITSYTAPWLSKKGFKVWLESTEANRAKRMSQRDGSTQEHALKTLRKREEENIKIYQKLYNIEFGKDKSVFALVVDTDNKSAEAVAEIIAEKFMESHAKK